MYQELENVMVATNFCNLKKDIRKRECNVSHEKQNTTPRSLLLFPYLLNSKP